MKVKVLPPISDDPRIGDAIEEAVKALLYAEIYGPISELLMDKDKIENKLDAKSALVSAIRAARISFYRGMFKGKFSAEITKELRALGAKWDAKEKSFGIQLAKLPVEIKDAIASSKAKFDRKAILIDERLAQMLPEEIASKLKLSDIFDSAFFKVDKEIKGSLTVGAALTEEGRARLAKEYETNYKLKIQDWTKTEVLKLRKEVLKSAMSGNRYEYLADKIKKSYGVSASKAKFLARQETNIVMAKYKEIRYQDAGVEEYIWKTAAGSPQHPVRPMHAALNGKIFRFDTPPVVNLKGDRKNPGCDYGCRCYARAVVRF